ncbi:MAG: hypothetical protein JWP39_1539, partial [Jatrophihabitans sp.]|nr:hypothetical protein [Jatrophihabitans sp.]
IHIVGTMPRGPILYNVSRCQIYVITINEASRVIPNIP